MVLPLLVEPAFSSVTQLAIKKSVSCEAFDKKLTLQHPKVKPRTSGQPKSGKSKTSCAGRLTSFWAMLSSTRPSSANRVGCAAQKPKHITLTTVGHLTLFGFAKSTTKKFIK